MFVPVGAADCLEFRIPVFCCFGAQALDAGMVFDQAPCGDVSGLVGIISAEQGFGYEVFDPFRKADGHAGGGDDAADMAEFGQRECRERIDGDFHQEHRSGPFPCDPEATFGFSACWRHGPEGPVGAGSVQFGAGFPAVPAAAGEDCVGAVVGAEDADAPAVFDQAWIEPAVLVEVAAHPRPCPVFGEAPASVCGAWVAGGEPFETAEGLEEAAPLGMDDEIDCAAAAASCDMIEEAGLIDTDHGSRAFPAGLVGGVFPVSGFGGDEGERDSALRRPAPCGCSQHDLVGGPVDVAVGDGPHPVGGGGDQRMMGDAVDLSRDAVACQRHRLDCRRLEDRHIGAG